MNRFAAALLAMACTLVANADPLPPEVVEALRPYAGFRTYRMPAWHPEGRGLLAIRDGTNAGELQRLEAPGAAPLPIALDGRVLAAAYRPAQGDSLVYLAERSDGSRRLYRYAAAGNAAAVSPPGEPVMEFTWSPQGERIAYATLADGSTGAGRARTTLHLVDPARAGSERLLARLDGRWKGLRFSPDGRRIALTQEVSPTESHLWVIEADTGKRRRVTRGEGKARGRFDSPAFARDGDSLFALSDRGSDYRRLVVVAIGSGAVRPLTAHLKYDVDAFAASDEAGLLAFLTNEGGSHVMRFIDLATLKEQPRPSLLDGVIGGLAWRPRSREIAFHVSSARTAGDVFSYEAKSNQVTRWTNGNAPGVNIRGFAEPQRIKWKSPDGHEITGLLYAPPSRFAGKRPVIVDHRAGHGSQWRTGFLGRANYLVSELGLALIRPNPRGSSGSGKAFAALPADDAYRDIAALMGWIGEQPALDESRTLVLGTGKAGEPDDDGFMAAAVDFARRARR